MTVQLSDLELRPEFTPQALRVLEARYLLMNGPEVEDPAAMLWRVASTVAESESQWGDDSGAWAERFYGSMARLEFLPNSPTLMNAGRKGGQLSACFVLPVEDSLDGIFDSVKDAARIHQTGGGTGFSFSRLRPRGAALSGRGAASGPVAFMRVFDAATGAVHQGGVRRGANMGILRVDHPDVDEFIEAKQTAGELTHFNLSVAVTDAFMKALESGGTYELVDPQTGVVTGERPAALTWERLVRAAWSTGDPGIVFIDAINAANPTPDLGEIESTNPCGEKPLLPYESCNLGSMDLSRHLNAERTGLDWDRLGATVELAVRFLDDVIDANAYPFKAIEDMTQSTRKIGLGVMGWADLLIELGVPYASERALELADEVMGFVHERAKRASRELATVRGEFPAWKGSRWERGGEAPLRNATLTTVAPTGTIALLADCSSGIEPLFALSYVRRALDGKAELSYFHDSVEALLVAAGTWSEAARARIATTGRLGPEDGDAAIRELLLTAHEVAPEWHVKMQAAFQRHVDSAVSKTINLSADAPPAEVDGAYRLAHRLGCKGITVYRDGCREGQVLSVCSGPDCAI